MCVGGKLLLLVSVLPALVGRCGYAEGEVLAAAPVFASSQNTSLVAPIGHAAVFHCSVVRLGDKTVSWVRSRDLQILTHAGVVFTADSRVTSSVDGGIDGGLHTLRIERLRMSDAGRYECQVNTEPKMSLFFNLTVVEETPPVTIVSLSGVGGVHERNVGQAMASTGAAVTLQCDARYEPPPTKLPLPPLDIRWYKDEQPISLQSPGGGISLETERWQWRAASRLTLGAAAVQDGGRYCCVAGDQKQCLLLQVMHSTDAEMEAMQRDQSAVARVSSKGSCNQLLKITSVGILLATLILTT